MISNLPLDGRKRRNRFALVQYMFYGSPVKVLVNPFTHGCEYTRARIPLMNARKRVASSPGGRNDRLVHTVMRMRLISEESRKIVYSCPRPQNGSTEGDLN